MKIIDFNIKGNVISLSLGEDLLEYWGGDDWDDSPYEHNAGEVLFGAVEYVEIALPMSVNVATPATDNAFHGNSPYCKNDFKERKAPIMVIDTRGYINWGYSYYDFSDIMEDDKITFIYMGDRFEDIDWKSMGAVLLNGDMCTDSNIVTLFNDSHVTVNCSQYYPITNENIRYWEYMVNCIDKLKDTFNDEHVQRMIHDMREFHNQHSKEKNNE